MQTKVEELSSAKALLQKEIKNLESEVDTLTHALKIREGDLRDKQVSYVHTAWYIFADRCLKEKYFDYQVHIEQLNRDLAVARQGESQVPLLEENIDILKKEKEEDIVSIDSLVYIRMYIIINNFLLYVTNCR